jgi:hypothetical protein
MSENNFEIVWPVELQWSPEEAVATTQPADDQIVTESQNNGDGIDPFIAGVAIVAFGVMAAMANDSNATRTAEQRSSRRSENH